MEVVVVLCRKKREEGGRFTLYLRGSAV